MPLYKKADMVLYHGQVVTDYVVIDEVLDADDDGPNYAVRFTGDDFVFTAHEHELSND